MKKYLKVLSIIVVVIMFCLSLSVTAFADDETDSEEEYADYARFYDFVSFDAKTKKEKHTIAVNASAHVSNFTLKFGAYTKYVRNLEKVSEETLQKFGVSNKICDNEVLENYLLSSDGREFSGCLGHDNWFYDYLLCGRYFYYDKINNRFYNLGIESYYESIEGYYENEDGQFEEFYYRHGSLDNNALDNKNRNIFDGKHYFCFDEESGGIKRSYNLERYEVDYKQFLYSSALKSELTLIEKENLIDLGCRAVVVKLNSTSPLPAGIYGYYADEYDYYRENFDNLCAYISMENCLFGEIESSLDGTFSSGIYNGVFAVTYNGNNVSDEQAYSYKDDLIVDLFSFTVSYKDRDKYLAILAFTETFFGEKKAKAGSIRDGKPYELKTDCSEPVCFAGDFDLDGEISVKDLITLQLFQVNSEYSKQFAKSTLLLLTHDDEELNLYVEELSESAFYPAQYLTMYLCEKISFAEFSKQCSLPLDIVGYLASSFGDMYSFKS